MKNSAWVLMFVILLANIYQQFLFIFNDFN